MSDVQGNVTNNGPKLGGITGKGFKPGQSGNPGGKPKGLMASVHAKCGKDGKKLVEAAYLLAMGTPADVRAFFGENVRRDGKVRMAAIQFLADRGYGKAADVFDAPDGDTSEPRAVTFGGRHKPDVAA